MLDMLNGIFQRLRAWMAENERAHRNAKPAGCCGSPEAIYAARRRPKGEGHHD